MNTYSHCFYSASLNSIVTFPHPTDPKFSLYGGSLDELKESYPDMVLTTTDKAQALIDSKYKTVPVKIDEEKFYEMLEILPPENWNKLDGGTYFQMCEYITGSITSYYVCYLGDFYTFSDAAWMKPEEVMARIKEVVK